MTRVSTDLAASPDGAGSKCRTLVLHVLTVGAVLISAATYCEFLLFRADRHFPLLTFFG